MFIISLKQAVYQIIEMYTKNNLGSLGRVHPNAIIKPQSPNTFKLKPLSQIENSLERLKARKKKSKSKSRSKQNTPEAQKPMARRSSISNQKNNTYFNRFPQKPKQTIAKLNSPKNNLRSMGPYGSLIGSYDNLYSKAPSEISINSRALTESNTTISINSEYQMGFSSQLSQKSVKFSDQHIQVCMNRMNSNKVSESIKERQKSSSILKKKLSLNSVTSQRSNSSAKNFIKTSRAKQLIQMQNVSANKLIKSKYQTLIRKYDQLNRKYAKYPLKCYNRLQKYTDDIFPPQSSSIFSYSIHNKCEKPKDIQWKRIPELFPNQNLMVLREENTKSLIKITKNSSLNKQFNFVEDYFLTSLNCIRQNKKFLQNFFQIKALNLCGIYLVKIYQENSWRYIVIDDFIPVSYDKSKEAYKPAFVNVQKAEGNTSDSLQIWPFLLEKAYATYYSKYQALKYGCETSFLQELTGVPGRELKVSKINFQNKEHLQIQSALREEKGIVLGQKVVDDKPTFFCIFPDLNSITKKTQGFCTVASSQKNFKPTKQKLQTFLANLTKIYIYQLNIPSNVTLSYLCPEHKRSTQGSVKARREALNSTPKQENEITLRCFSLSESTNAVLTVRQKDERFYFQGKIQYSYVWVRTVLLMKEHNNDYRWIDGKYSNDKTLKIFLKLQPGEYFLLIMPEWNITHKYDLTISLYTECAQVNIEKKLYDKNQEIFEKGCADIAQRQGSMNQINKYICAYNFVTEETGLVVQNINNERQSGPVTVMRSINGLKCQVNLVPVNKQFYYCTSSQYDNEAGKKMRKTIEVDIEANGHYTVVLKTLGGIDHKFFQSFDFGS